MIESDKIDYNLEIFRNKKMKKQKKIHKEDTIAAVSTPIGVGGIGIVRLSGLNAISIVKSIFIFPSGKLLKKVKSHKVLYGFIFNPETNKKIDEVLLTIFKRPKSFTREDVAEISSHGGMVVLGEILELVINCGAKMAAPGEFTKRAFLNGRIDLAQAESVIDIIRAKTRASLQIAVNQLEGKLSKTIKESRKLLLNAMVDLEAAIDFPDEDIVFPAKEDLFRLLEDLIKKFNEFLEESKRGRILKEGLKITIIGKPNVGKSSLLNAILGRKRAIVTSVPGTTRDIIKESVNISGIPVILHDTAGIRDTEDEIEKEGVGLSKESLGSADLILFLVDGSESLEKEDFLIAEEVKDKKTVVVINKSDLKEKINIADLKNMGFKNITKISALKAEGIDEVEKIIYKMFIGNETNGVESVLITSIRHQLLLEEGLEFLLEANNALNNNYSEDLVVASLREASDRLGEIVGEIVSEEILDEIFGKFCIGK